MIAQFVCINLFSSLAADFHVCAEVHVNRHLLDFKMSSSAQTQSVSAPQTQPVNAAPPEKVLLFWCCLRLLAAPQNPTVTQKTQNAGSGSAGHIKAFGTAALACCSNCFCRHGLRWRCGVPRLVRGCLLDKRDARQHKRKPVRFVCPILRNLARSATPCLCFRIAAPGLCRYSGDSSLRAPLLHMADPCHFCHGKP